MALVLGTGCWCWCCELAALVPVLVLGAGCRRWCCQLAVHVEETGCWCWCCRCWPGASAGDGVVSGLHVVETGCWCWCWVPGGADPVSWTWWRQVAGAGCRVPVLVRVPVAVPVPGAGAGRRVPCAGCARGGDRLLVPVLVLGAGRRCCEAAHVVETGCWCRCWCMVLVLVL